MLGGAYLGQTYLGGFVEWAPSGASDTLTFVDGARDAMNGAAPGPGDTVALSDAATANMTSIQGAASGAIALSDSAASRLTALRAAVDALSLTDSGRGAAVQTASDAVSLWDTAMRILTMVAAAGDGINLVDGAIYRVVLNRAGTDALLMTDVANVEFRTAAESEAVKATVTAGIVTIAEALISAVTIGSVIESGVVTVATVD